MNRLCFTKILQVCCLALFLICSSNTFAQIKESEKIKQQIIKKLEEPLPVKVRINSLYYLAQLYGYNSKEHINNLEKGFKLSEKTKFKPGIALGNILFGNYYSITYGNNSKAIEYYQKALVIYEELKDDTNIMYCYVCLGDTYDEMENFEKAFEYNLKGYEYAKKKNSKDNICMFTWNLGFIYCEMNLPKKAFPYFQICSSTAETIKTDKEYYVSSAHTGLGIAYSCDKNYKKALEHFYKGQYHNDTKYRLAYLMNNYYFLADLYKKTNQIDSSIVNYNRVLDLEKEINSPKMKLDTYNALAHIYKTKDPNLSKKYENLATEIKNKLYSKQQLQETQLLTFNEQQRQQQLALQEKKQKEQQIQLLLKEKNLAQDKKNIQLFTFLAIIVFLVLLLTLLYYAYKNKIATAHKTKEINDLKSRFFTNISHEFRTPLTLIKSPLQSLEGSISDQKQRHELALIDKNANRMLELIDQLLEISKIESGHLKLILKEGNLGIFLASIIEPFDFEAKENQINFKYSIEKTQQHHYFDKDIIEKIVTNLLSNAFKYSPKNELISFTSTIQNDVLQLRISNTNNELKKEDLSKLFERFYQKNENSKGVGIGLALVKELVAIYNGTLETDIDNHILTFSIGLPLEKNLKNSIVVQEEKWIEDETSVEEMSNDLPILLVAEDNHDIRKIIASLFNEHYRVIEAEDGEQAWQLAQKEIPDCIISDVMMPKMNGYQLTNNIKTNPITSFIPVVLLTAKSSDESQLEGLKNHADAYITKPFNNQIVKATVLRLIDDRKKIHEHYQNGFMLNDAVIELNHSDKKFIEKVQKIITKELSNAEFSADEFAKEIGMSRMQLHRKLKSVIGVSVTELLRNERLKTAAKLFAENPSIAEVAYAVGFNNISYFSKCFKEMYQQTPSEYIDNL